MTYVDAWVNMPVAAADVLVRPDANDPLLANLNRWFHAEKALRVVGSTVDELLARMDGAGVEKALLTTRYGWHHPDTRPRGVLQPSYGMPDAVFDQFCAEVAEATRRYPGRLYGTAMIDPWGGMTAVRQLERAVKEFGMVAARLFPAAHIIPINHPLCYVIYSKCIELGVPITINIGVPGPMRPAHVQQPMLLDEVLLALPELVAVGTHVGHPWHLETIALLQRHPNFNLMTSGWAPKYIPTEIIQALNTRASRQIMWASDYPLLSIERTIDEALALPIKDDDVRRRYMRDNCLEVFKIG